MDLHTFSPKRILVCQLRQLGDVVLATPALELLRHRYPNAVIDFFTESKCVPLLAGNPNVNHVWGLNKKQLKPMWREVAWYWKVARSQYDLVVDFQQLPRCRWVVAFSGAPVRLSYSPPWYTRALYTHWAEPIRTGYAAQCKASVLAPLGIEWNGEKPRIYLSCTERSAARAFLSELGLLPEHCLITLDPTHRQETRRWPLAHYAELVRLLCEARPDVRILPLWGPGEEKEIHELAAAVASGKNFSAQLLLPQKMLDLREMAAVLACARLHVGNCSAPRHMAVAVDTPTCVVRGSTSDEWTYPSAEHCTVSAGLECQPCNLNHCAHKNCLVGLRPQEVVGAVLGMVGASVD